MPIKLAWKYERGSLSQTLTPLYDYHMARMARMAQMAQMAQIGQMAHSYYELRKTLYMYCEMYGGDTSAVN